jgi:hypothetical protein
MVTTPTLGLIDRGSAEARALPGEARRLSGLLEEKRRLRLRLAEVEADIEGVMARRAMSEPPAVASAQGGLAYRLPRVAELLDVSVDVVKREVLCGNLKSRLIGGCRVVLAGEIEGYLASLPERREDP